MPPHSTERKKSWNLQTRLVSRMEKNIYDIQLLFMKKWEKYIFPDRKMCKIYFYEYIPYL